MLEIRRSIGHLPDADLVIGYGSSVFKQAGFESHDQPLVDLLVAASDREAFIRKLAASRIVPKSGWMFSSLLNPEVSFFADVDMGMSYRFKLGIVSTSSLIDRLNDWDTSFYLPGRLQKPTIVIGASSNDILAEFSLARNCNLKAGLAAALLAMPPNPVDGSFMMDELWHSLVGLSYLGDIRVGLAENPMKIRNIVAGQSDYLLNLYRPFFAEVGLVDNNIKGRYVCNLSRADLWESLPFNFRRRAVSLVDPRSSVLATLTNINRRESMGQAIAGVATSGPSVAARYLFRKVVKRFK